MKKPLLLCLVMGMLLSSHLAWAAPLKVFVARMNVTGVPNHDEMQSTMQTLLASRLTSDSLVTVSSQLEADVVVNGSYVVFGKIFSLDAVATTANGKTVTRAYVQGEGQDELIPVVGKIAEKLSTAIVQWQTGASTSSTASKPGNPVSVAPSVASPPEGEIIKLKDTAASPGGSWRSPPIEGVFNLIAAGNKRADGSRDIFLADDRRLLHYRQGEELKLLAIRELKLHEKIIALDVLDAGKDSIELYLTIMSNEQLASQILEAKGDQLRLVAENQPYFFRIMVISANDQRLYVQKTGDDRVYSGEVFEAERKGGEIILKNPLSLPKFTSIYSFAKFAGNGGKQYTAIMTPDNYLVAYDQQNREIWRSSEKYGGTELYMEKRTQESLVRSVDEKPKIYMNQRIQVTSAGDLLVCRNDALWLLGNTRNYNKGTVYGFRWSGDSLEGKWQTRSSQYYVPDYAFDGSQKELLLLEVVNKAYILSKGASAISIKKVE
jgi:hypothetical protein